ncbi:MAG: VWA domain-containing protein [Planctomycetota bacterium]
MPQRPTRPFRQTQCLCHTRRFATAALLLALLPLAPLGCTTAPSQTEPAATTDRVSSNRVAQIDAILTAYRQGDHDQVQSLLAAFPADDPAAVALNRLIHTTPAVPATAPATQPDDPASALSTHRITETALAYTEWRSPGSTRTGSARTRAFGDRAAGGGGGGGPLPEGALDLGVDTSHLAVREAAVAPALVTPAPPASPSWPAPPGAAPTRAEAPGEPFDHAVHPARRPDPGVTPTPTPDAPAPTAGTLTAGSLDDLADPQPLVDFAKTFKDGHPIADRFAGPNFALRITDADGNPLPNALVLVHDNRDHTFATLTTAPDGRAALSMGHDNIPESTELFATVYYPGTAPFTTSVHPDTPETHTLTLPDAAPESVDRLDLAFVIDCTGSMGDEIRYLQAELKDVVATTAAKHPETDIRLSLIVYRDTTDNYVVRVSDWTRDVDAFLGMLDKQSANGGGDYPEAVDQALRAAAGLDWQPDTSAAARVVFLVGDAPSHQKHMPSALDAVDELRASGVRVYPVLGSQDGDEPQLLFRAAALLTGARHLFLTDDSGVGNPHAEPKQGASFDVEPLNALMARILDAELTGQPIEKGDAVIRRVDG